MNNLAINISNAPAKSSASQPASKDDLARQDGQGFGNVLTRQVAEADKPSESTPPTSGEGASSQPVRQSAKQAASKAPNQDDAETAPAADSANAGFLPADMLAALLAQQNLTATAQADGNLQSALDSQTAASTSEAVDMKAVASGAAELKAVAPGAAELKAVAPGAAELKAAAPGAAELKAVAPGAAELKAVASGKASAPAASEIKGAASTALAGANVKPADTGLPASDTTRTKAESAVKDSKGFAETLKASFGTNESTPASGSHSQASAIGELTNTVQQPVMAAPLPNVAATASPLSISTPVTQAAWGDEFSQKITWMVSNRNQSAELHLNPPQLGPLDVVLKVNGDQATAMFTSPHAAVRDAIEQALPKLREMLADNGIMLGNAMVSDQTARNHQDGTAPKSQGRAMTSDNSTETAGVKETRISRTSRHDGMVDTFA